VNIRITRIIASATPNNTPKTIAATRKPTFKKWKFFF
jgi:hypothetical protein